MGNQLTREEPTTDLPTTPTLIPKINPEICLDPRSPSANIVRTPLLLTSSLKPSDEEIEEEKPKTLVLAVDPRSPTTEYVRTPIVVGQVEKVQKIRNKNLDKVRQCDIQLTPVRSIGDKRITPKLLESSPKIVNVHLKRKSFVGLLETNIDFTETNLDDVLNKKCLPESPVKEMEVLEAKTEEISIREEKEIVEKAQNQTTDPLVNVTAQVNDFNKKLTNLIYEDTDNEVLKIVKTKQNRTPLSDRNGDIKKSASKLKVSDRPRKRDSGTKSRIPVLNKKRDENTPPGNLNGRRKNKKLDWDNSDKTLVI